VRIRTIKPEFWAHPILGRLPDRTQLLALALLSMADDHGYFHADPAIVRGSVAPFRESLASVSEDLARLSKSEWIDLWDHPQQGAMGKIKKWSDHQKIDHPSKSKLAAYDIREELATASRESREELALDQGSGIREQGSGKGKETSMSDKPDEPDLFETFWDAYDKKEGRKPAFSSWKRLSKADQQAAIDGIPEYHRNVRDRQYRKQAQGYLTQRLWENEYPADSGQIPWGQPQEQSDPWAKPTHIAQQSPETKAWLAEIEAGCKEHDRAIALADAAQAAMHATRRAKERPPVPQTVDPSQDEALNG